MAQKFGNNRWVQEGFLDNRRPGTVVGRMTFAVLGAVDFYLVGDCRGEIAGKVIRFKNSRFVDEDLAGQVMGDVEIPQIGDASLISFDPHPHLVPHPYVEWFSMRKNHYRIELVPEDAWIATEEELVTIDPVSLDIRDRLMRRRGPRERYRLAGAATIRHELACLGYEPLRLGEPEDLLGAVLWLISPTSAYVTGVILPVDGGFSAFGGV